MDLFKKCCQEIQKYENFLLYLHRHIAVTGLLADILQEAHFAYTH
jgi:hypothetical protein